MDRRPTRVPFQRESDRSVSADLAQRTAASGPEHPGSWKTRRSGAGRVRLLEETLGTRDQYVAYATAGLIPNPQIEEVR